MVVALGSNELLLVVEDAVGVDSRPVRSVVKDFVRFVVVVMSKFAGNHLIAECVLQNGKRRRACHGKCLSQVDPCPAVAEVKPLNALVLGTVSRSKEQESILAADFHARHA